ncbi:acyl dehydratase [Leucobacter exalbidus]|uniref:Acyl dehydratase n=1 Tax=Leucobacter exalbidus TaxID=662960 RepID=A0A940PNP0_9MICO|nr:acyl dehydratase [Leucobacter exalbidus]
MTQQRIIDGTTGFTALIGKTVGTSDWLLVDQRMIDRFGANTGDEQWIHVDPERASTGPFGGTIAHGFLLLSLIPALANQTFEAIGFSARVNYGLEKVRFPQPLLAGSSIRDTVTVVSVEATPTGSRITFGHVVESDSGGKPVCVAQTVILFTSASTPQS